MNIYKCDRCGKEVTTTIYSVDINAKDVNDSMALNNSETLGFNLSRAMKITFSNKRYYCRDCRLKFERFLTEVEE